MPRFDESVNKPVPVPPIPAGLLPAPDPQQRAAWFAWAARVRDAWLAAGVPDRAAYLAWAWLVGDRLRRTTGWPAATARRTSYDTVARWVVMCDGIRPPYRGAWRR
jgi:hypothetical protein